MEHYSVVIAVICFVFFCALGRRLARLLYLSSKIPGPSLWQLLTVHAKHLLGDGMITYTWKMCASYRYKPWGMWSCRLNYMVMVSDCETISAVYKSKSARNKPEVFYGRMSEFVGESLLTMNGPKYPRHRKVFGNALRKSLQDNFLRRMPKPISEFVEAVRQKTAGGGSDVDLRYLVLWHMMAAMRAAFTTTSNPKMLAVMQICVDYFSRRLELIQMEALNPFYYWLFEHFRSSNKQNRAGCDVGLTAFDDILMDEKSRVLSGDVQRSEDAQEIHQCMVLSYYRTSCGEEINDQEFCWMGRIGFIASFETTAFMFTTLLLVLALHQDVQQRVVDEIDSVLGKETQILGNDLERLEYMEMVIKETLRLFPAAPLLPRSVSEETDFNGVLVPAGSIIMINIMALHRNPEYFPDPLKFDPSRFSSEASKERRPYTYIPFSSGYRNCPGQLHAFVMLKLMLCHFLRNFSILPGDKLKSLDDIKVKMFFTMHLEDCSLRLLNRSSEKALPL